MNSWDLGVAIAKVLLLTYLVVGVGALILVRRRRMRTAGDDFMRTDPTELPPNRTRTTQPGYEASIRGATPHTPLPDWAYVDDDQKHPDDGSHPVELERNPWMTGAAPEPGPARIPLAHNASVLSTFVRPLLLVAVIASLALSGCGRQAHHPPAPPADVPSAPDPKALNGTYTFFADGTRQTVNGQPRTGGLPSTTTWRITPCGTACADVISSLGWTVKLRLAQNTWTATRTLDVDCGHGASTIIYSINADTLAGTLTNYIPCGSNPSTVALPAKLTKN